MALIRDGSKRQPPEALDHREGGKHRQNVEPHRIRLVFRFDIRVRWRGRGLYGAVSWWLLKYGRLDRPLFVHGHCWLATNEASRGSAGGQATPPFGAGSPRLFTNIGGVARRTLKEFISAMDGEGEPRYGSVQRSSPGDQYRAHPGRFYVLIAFSLFALVQSLGWLTFGTIPDESYEELGLTDSDVTLIAGVYV